MPESEQVCIKFVRDARAFISGPAIAGIGRAAMFSVYYMRPHEGACVQTSGYTFVVLNSKRIIMLCAL